MKERWWGRLWRFWVIFGVLYEFYCLLRGRPPLTGEARKRLLGYSGGSALVGAFLTWLLYHWGFDSGGSLGWLDALSVIIGAVAGFVGWRIRGKGRE